MDHHPARGCPSARQPDATLRTIAHLGIRGLEHVVGPGAFFWIDMRNLGHDIRTPIGIGTCAIYCFLADEQHPGGVRRLPSSEVADGPDRSNVCPSILVDA